MQATCSDNYYQLNVTGSKGADFVFIVGGGAVFI